MKKQDYLLWICLIVVALIDIGGIVGTNLNKQSTTNIRHQYFNANYPYQLETTNLKQIISDSTCESEFIKQYGGKSNLKCFIESWFYSDLKYYNGDGIESYLDQDLINGVGLNCYCEYN